LAHTARLQLDELLELVLASGQDGGASVLLLRLLEGWLAEVADALHAVHAQRDARLLAAERGGGGAAQRLAHTRRPLRLVQGRHWAAKHVAGLELELELGLRARLS